MFVKNLARVLFFIPIIIPSLAIMILIFWTLVKPALFCLFLFVYWTALEHTYSLIPQKWYDWLFNKK